MKIQTLWRVPPDLGEHGQAIWKRVGRELVKNESLDDLDRETFETMCRSYDMMKVAALQMTTDGITVDGGRGVPKKHPAFAIWKTSHDSYVRLLALFGLSPASRGVKVSPKEEKKDDGKSRFFK